jgi:galactokinase
MMGGGFGGCTINLVEKADEESIIAKVTHQYFDRFNIMPETYKVNISDGTSEYK